MNSLFKRYLYIGLVFILLSSLYIWNTGHTALRDIDRFCNEITETGNISKETLISLNAGYCLEGDKPVPNIEASMASHHVLYDTQYTWLILTLMGLLFMYLPEKSYKTADVNAVFPVRARAKFLAKLLITVVSATVAVGIYLAIAHGYNLRMGNIINAYNIMGIESRFLPLPVDMASYTNFVVSNMLIVLVLLSIFMLFTELCSSVTTAIVISVTSLFASIGSLMGLDHYLETYEVTSLRRIVNKVVYVLIDGPMEVIFDNPSYLVQHLFFAAVFLVVSLIALYTSGKGDIAVKGSIFRFPWLKPLLTLGIFISATLCSFVVLYATEISYSLSAVSAFMAMVFMGIVACFIFNKLLFTLGARR